MRSLRLLTRGGGALAILALSGCVAVQSPTPGADIGLGTRIAIRCGALLLVNLLIGGALVTLGPQYATRTVTDLRTAPGRAFGWGLLVGIGVPIVLGLLAITIIGLLITIPGLILLAGVALVGNAVTIVWVGAAITGTNSAVDGTTAIVGAVVLAILAALPVFGQLLITFLGFFGTGVVGRNLYVWWQG